jgi:hypothetical protein
LEVNVNTQYNRYRPDINGFDGQPLPLPYSLEADEIKSIWPKPEREVDGVKAASDEAKPAVEPHSPGLGKRIKDAMQSDYNPAESLAAIRAILMGPTSRLNEARMEEIVSILEESDRASQIAIRSLESRCDKLSAELQKAADKQGDNLADLFVAVDSKFLHINTEINDRFEEKASETEAEIRRIGLELNARMKEHEEKLSANFYSLSKELEDRFAGQDEHVEKIQLHSAEVFVQGFSDITKRLTALRRSYLG